MKRGLHYILTLIGLMMVTSVMAQSHEAIVRNALRLGNRYFHQGNYDKAEAEYLKAYEVDSNNVHVLYNLGTTYLMKQDLKPANDKLLRASQSEAAKNKLKGARIFHNLGVNLQMNQDYDKAITAYKQSLRLNPTDDETRYNLALCQKLRKDNPQQNQQKQDQKKDQDKQDQQKQQQQKQDQKQDQQEQPQQQQQQPQQPQDQMSKENAQQLLEAVKQDEKAVKQRMNQQPKNGTRRKKQKDW